MHLIITIIDRARIVRVIENMTSVDPGQIRRNKIVHRDLLTAPSKILACNHAFLTA